MSDPVDHRPSDARTQMKDDLARALPEPPPPRAVRREKAIATALERFDAVEVPSSMERPALVSRHQAWWRTGRAQLGAFASIALVAMITVPLALKHPDVRVGAPPETGAPHANERVAASSDGAAPPGSVGALRSAPPASAAPPSSDAALSRTVRPDGAAPATGAPAPAPEVASLEPAPIAAAAPPPPPPPPPPPAPASVVAREALAETSGALQPTPSAAADYADVVVTGSRVSRRARAASRRGDWNACTVLDPEQSLRGCPTLIHPGSGTADAQLAHALALGWQENWNGAIQALDRAITFKPRLGIAYLNRGLAREHLGDADEALADLDRAVRYEHSARSYFARARLRRTIGDVRGARADEDRAVDLDADYAEVVEK